ncbi:hypothetical protein [Ktedonobacter racemifer]|uniref:Uncharacterized protein n=1 Tax=Ktedonobacter racemifer DSM 44963 TaxID=485913 RepID=D6TGS1_KTERA|nr:hypothetical protein [Ktedonobacter racemifer]EFH88850.1 hypothetical protein Krac_10352 [Ktedonobacter racemifer DSM 44963]
MSERQAKRQRRAERKAAATHEAIPPRPPLGASPHLTGQPSVASSHLAIALSAAVPLRVLGLYERQGPDKNDLEAAHHVGTLLASKGDRLLFRSEVRGETADIFNQTAQALAVLSFAPGGVTCFGHHFDAQKILSGFFGAEAAERYCQQVTGTPLAAQQEQTTAYNEDER